MSGHSKWANIKNRKGAQDKKRSEAFTKISKNILTAIRLGGGSTNPEVNGALKVAIDKAREVNMPKENIQRLLDRFEERKANLVSVVLEGYGPFGVPVIIEAETDNKNRILGEIKLIFKNYEGALGESNSVMYQFDRVGEVELENMTEENQLELIDLGAMDFDEKIVIIETSLLNDFVKKVEESGFKVIRSESVYRAKNPVILANEDQVEKILDFVDELESNDDVLGVFCGFDYN
ncbi:MAG: YebC/PmpR family DNA-binding transcriptional regulator [Candidatus Shapirobacteria bacterium]|nr:YebC/PmpR family DNA-binding transcriptional regulator [Candidatus Shapirobacteria bacterium]